MIYSSQVEGEVGGSPKKSMIIINGKKCNSILKSSFAILYPEYLFEDELDQIIKIDFA